MSSGVRYGVFGLGVRVSCVRFVLNLIQQKHEKKGGAVIHMKGRTAGGVINEIRQYL